MERPPAWPQVERLPIAVTRIVEDQGDGDARGLELRRTSPHLGESALDVRGFSRLQHEHPVRSGLPELDEHRAKASCVLLREVQRLFMRVATVVANGDDDLLPRD